MRIETKTQKEDREESGVFAVIPMEQLSGLDETLWLEQMAENKAPKSHKKSGKTTKNSR